MLATAPGRRIGRIARAGAVVRRLGDSTATAERAVCVASRATLAGRRLIGRIAREPQPARETVDLSRDGATCRPHVSRPARRPGTAS